MPSTILFFSMIPLASYISFQKLFSIVSNTCTVNRCLNEFISLSLSLSMSI